MAEVDPAKTPSLSEHYLLEGKDKPAPQTTINPVEEAEVKTPLNTATEEVVEKIEETPVATENTEAVEGSNEAAGSESTESVPSVEPTNQDVHATSEEVSESDSSAVHEADDETPEIKLETAPADFRFPTTNQSRHCFTRYIEYHRCIAAKGDDAPECQKFAKYYRSLCPGEWIDRWNEQRENGTFPGPL